MKRNTNDYLGEYGSAVGTEAKSFKAKYGKYIVPVFVGVCAVIGAVAWAVNGT